MRQIGLLLRRNITVCRETKLTSWLFRLGTGAQGHLVKKTPRHPPLSNGGTTS